MSDVTINLNQNARVRLTEVGRVRYHALYGWKPVLEADGSFRTALWVLMRDFGFCLGNGITMPFESTDIVVEPFK